MQDTLLETICEGIICIDTFERRLYIDLNNINLFVGLDVPSQSPYLYLSQRKDMANFERIKRLLYSALQVIGLWLTGNSPSGLIYVRKFALNKPVCVMPDM